MPAIPASLRRTVIQRANNRCEYCQLSQEGQIATFHIDHITPVVAGGPTTEANLALACVACSLHKAAKETVQDPLTGEWLAMFHPRQQLWQDHFAWEGVALVKVLGVERRLLHSK
jgi:hypothetical protein